MYRFHDILAKSTPPRVTVATKPSHAQNPAAMPAPSVFAPIQPTSMLSTAAVTSEPIKVKVMVFPMPSRLMLCWLMPIIDIHVLPKSGPYQTQPMINCAIAAITMATQFTGCHPLWFLLQLESWSVGKLDGPNSSTLQLFNSPTLQLSNSAVSVLPRMCGSPARPPPAAPAAPQQPCAPPPRWPSARRP